MHAIGLGDLQGRHWHIPINEPHKHNKMTQAPGGVAMIPKCKALATQYGQCAYGLAIPAAGRFFKIKSMQALSQTQRMNFAGPSGRTSTNSFDMMVRDSVSGASSSLSGRDVRRVTNAAFAAFDTC